MDGMIGKTLGKYQIVELLGEGGMATVYKAFDPSLERYVAIKIIRMINQIDPLFLARFQREAKALAKLDHPYILKVLDYGEEEGMPYLVMPFVGHGTLKQYTQSHLPYDQAIRIILPIAEALCYAHKRNIIHRDIKPANILFGESGEPILSDFGIAKILDAGGEQTQLTGAGFGIGTPAYMAPEQWNGVADERTDIYALGIVLYELLTSRCPFQADTPAAILLKQVQDPLPRPKDFAPEVPDHVEALIFKALAKDPSLRFQTMQDFINAMNAVLQNKTVPFASPPAAISGQTITQVASRPADIKPSPIYMKPEPEPKKHWIPWVIGGGIILTAGWIIFLVVGASKLGFLTKKDASATMADITQAITSENVQGNASATDIPQETKTTDVSLYIKTLESVDTIDKLPEDIPVFTPNNGDVTTTQSEGTLMFSYSTSEENTKVADFFAEGMKNNDWELVSTSEMAAQNAFMYAFSKDNRNAVIYVYQYDTTYVQIMLSDEVN